MSKINSEQEIIEFNFIEIIKTLLDYKFLILFIFLVSTIPFFYERENRTKSLFGEIIFVNNHPSNNIFLSEANDYGLETSYFEYFEKNLLLISDSDLEKIIKNEIKNVENLIAIKKYFSKISFERIENTLQSSQSEQTLKINLITPEIVSSPEILTSFLESVIINAHNQTINDIKRNFEILSNQRKRILKTILDDVESYYIAILFSLNENQSMALKLGIIDPFENMNLAPHINIDPLSPNNFLLGTKYLEQKIYDVETRLKSMNIQQIMVDPMIINSYNDNSLFNFQVKKEIDFIDYMLSNLDSNLGLNNSIIIKNKKSTVITQAMPSYPYLLPIFIPFLSMILILLYAYYRKVS